VEEKQATDHAQVATDRVKWKGGRWSDFNRWRETRADQFRIGRLHNFLGSGRPRGDCEPEPARIRLPTVHVWRVMLLDQRAGDFRSTGSNTTQTLLATNS